MTYLYICSNCLYINDGDFWECPKCHNESDVVQVRVKTFGMSQVLLSFNSTYIHYKEAEQYIKAIINERFPNMSIYYSQHSAILSGMILEFVIQ